MIDEPGNADGDNMPDWDNLQDVWQDTPPVDMAKLVRNARFVWWRMRINFVAEIVASVVGAIVFGTLVDFSSLPATLVGGFGMLYCGIAFWAAIHIRRGAWGSNAGEDALLLVQLQIRRARSMLLYIKLNSWLGYAALLLVVLGYWLLFDRFGSFDNDGFNHVHWVFGVMVFLILAFPLALRPFVRKKKFEISMLEKIEAQLLEA